MGIDYWLDMAEDLFEIERERQLLLILNLGNSFELEDRKHWTIDMLSTTTSRIVCDLMWASFGVRDRIRS